MDAVADKDWKTKVGFPINFDSGQSSSEDDFDSKDVVMRHPRQSSRFLLADGGDGSEADLLGTTPPRSRIRNKEKRRNLMDLEGGFPRIVKEKKDDIFLSEQAQERLKKRYSLKNLRMKERDWKQDMGQQEHRADSLPSPNPVPAVPTLVESCSRFMSLTSKLKSREVMTAAPDPAAEVEERTARNDDEEMPANRATFHKTFSLLINMGNIDKGCKRTISREEQVWQNELKDLIWLELQAKVAGRTLAQQDYYLCQQRKIVPNVIQKIIDYRFVNDGRCTARKRALYVVQGSREDSDHSEGKNDWEAAAEAGDDEGPIKFGCLSFDCQPCIDAIGKAMREVGTLLDSFYSACELYPSTKAMTAGHPLVATKLFKDRIKAMCVWYNSAHHLRMKLVSVRRMMRTMRMRGQRRHDTHRASLHSDLSRQSSETHRLVRFDVSNNPTDSSNSETSSHSEGNRDDDKQVDTGVKETEGQDAGVKETEREGSEEAKSSDETDAGIEKKFESNGDKTPEIVISDNRYGTADTTTSTESGYASADTDASLSDVDAACIHEVTRLRLLGKCAVSPYREYHYDMLKTQSVRRCMLFMNKMRMHLLHKTYLTLEKDDSEKEESYEENAPVEVFDDTKDDPDLRAGDEDHSHELKRYGCWCKETVAMRLPSYRNHFLLLSSICMEAVHDYLALRLDASPDAPSCLTVKQLMHELKEGLDIATEMRSTLVRNIEVAVRGYSLAHTAHNDLLMLIRTFDSTVKAVFQQYLSYLKMMSAKEHVGRSSLQAEWSFTARLARRIRWAAVAAPHAFSEIACNQLNRLLKQFESKFEQLDQMEKAEQESDVRYMVYALCRGAQSIYSSEREATLHAAQWARALAARLARAPPPAYSAQREDIFNSMMSIRDCIGNHTETILERSRVEPDDQFYHEYYDNAAARVRELLLQIYKLGFELHKELYLFAQAAFKLQEERVGRPRAPPRPSSLQPPRPSAPPLRRRRPDTVLFNTTTADATIHKELHRFVYDAASNRAPAPAPASASHPPPPPPPHRRSLHVSPPKLNKTKFLRSESIGETADTAFDKMFENLNTADSQTQSSIELLLSGQLPNSEPVELRWKEATEAEATAQEKQWAERVARAIISFARCWMKFVVERCDRGRGLRPRWASQGLEFLMLACDPRNTKHLSEEDFENLKQEMDGCISHVIGSRGAARHPDTATLSPTPARHRKIRSPISSTSTVSSGCNNNGICKEVPTPPTPPTEPDPLPTFNNSDLTVHSRRVAEAVRRVDAERDELLRARRSVGRVTEAATPSPEPKLRQLTFKWQRGLKIGAGTFGKVYTVVNTESGQLLAMKELSLGAGDRRAMQRAANELRVLEGVIHPHLVRYYGCELHREEMLLFMELCVEGSLETLVATSGALDEPTVRRYTKQLLSAVAELHHRSIAHRDIKSGNIFLTNEGHCLKLGDFGCAVKIRANTTAPGELQGFVGTQAYMAPEVFMKSSGHGRAADIWSLGCVVTEMASGKRPFFEYDSNYQIMFVVGMGGRPSVPAALSEEGRRFCVSCLTHDPDLRPRAEALSLHHFLMVMDL